MLRITVCAAGVAAAFGAMTTPADAQAPQRQERRDGIEEVLVTSTRLDQPATTSSRLGLSALETPASIYVLDGELMRERGDFVIQDAVSRVVGVVDQGTSGNGGGGVSQRGFNGVNSVMRLYDGVQMFVVAGTMTFPSDTWTVDRIEVLGGPSSVLYGTGAIGGVINVIPRKPQRDADQTYRMTAGSFGTYRAAMDSTGPIGERFSYRVSLSGQSQEGWQDRGESSGFAVSASMRWDVSDDFNLTLSQDYGDQRPATTSSIPLVNGEFVEELSQKNYNYLNADRFYQDSWLQLKAEWTPSDDVTVRSNMYSLTADRRWFGSTGATYVPSTDRVLRGNGTDLYHDLRQYGNVTTATFSRDLFGKGNSLAVGFDVNRVSFEHVNWTANNATSLDPYNPDVGYYEYLPGGFTMINQFHANQYALFVEDNFSLTERLSLLGGVRFDFYDVDRLERLNGSNSEAQFDPESWRVGLLYDIKDDFTVYGSLSNATDPAGSVGNMSAAAQQMELMQGEQIEIGAKREFADGRGQWTVALYDIVKNNLQVSVPDQPGVTQQVGQQSSQGIEVSGAFAITDNLRIEANAARLDAVFDDFAETVAGAVISRDGNTPPNTPEESANVWVTWTFLTNWQMRTGVRYVGEQWADNANSRTVDSYTVLDGGVRWKPSGKSTFDLRLYNATDLLYAPRGSSATAWRPADPRSVELTWTYTP
jgi:iron complex outermembrane recepter protein